MKSNESEILEIAEKVKTGDASLDELKQALGGDKLYSFLNGATVDVLLKTVIETGRIHKLLENENGFDTLEGLLNNEITGNVSRFYNINPDYIINLPEKERKNMANAIAGNWRDLSNSLQALWSRGIMTVSCTTCRDDNLPMLNMLVNEKNFDYIANIYNQPDIEVDKYLYNIFDVEHRGYFSIALIGEDLYKYVSGEKPLKPSKPKEDVFEKALEENLEFFFKEWMKNGVTFKEIDVEAEYKREQEMLSRLKNKNRDRDNDEDER